MGQCKRSRDDEADLHLRNQKRQKESCIGGKTWVVTHFALSIGTVWKLCIIKRGTVFLTKQPPF
ncbi:hypothetical protein TRIP_E90085 [uncultured Spirochaetota bacterium]|uniref:Uncharacterized protein n=1 Tax=uncultured Spirochaetota bacterium TaxID=460511 RepID=A0A652ZZS1_9SPIR|nr:hypothetical protein TRIP_E90085 [uncultured Spirochaetota bacterium]